MVTGGGPAARCAIVTGANRGIGREVARQLAVAGWTVVLASRSAEEGRAAAAELAAGGLHVVPEQLDVSDDSAAGRVVGAVADRFGRVDALVNNAGVYLDDPRRGHPVGIEALDLDLLARTLDVNLYGAVRTIQAVLPVMRTAGYGRIVNVSSGMGRWSKPGADAIAYRLSKGALNLLTRLVACDLEGEDVLVNAVCPGWVRTDMGGPAARRPVEEAAAGVVWAATLPTGGPSGRLFRDGVDIGW